MGLSEILSSVTGLFFSPFKHIYIQRSLEVAEVAAALSEVSFFLLLLVPYP